ncbi:hypothetical protein PIB30_052886 [Stylosanthes scabra]|uniref:Uncharacterized protein n=1 Tax=Stylosanthes scabra TaxID=79078 RepID=A0ABU6ZH39_9FABA|nr:hypothetical protein [Stylosanthes scabra]
MARIFDPALNQASTHHKLSRLQRRAPSSLQLNWVVDGNVAIPLLSPLSSFPTTQQPNPKSQGPPQWHHDVLAEKASTVMAFLKWQHPAARALLYDPALVVALFVPMEFAGGRFDRKSWRKHDATAWRRSSDGQLTDSGREKKKNGGGDEERWKGRKRDVL